MNIFRVVLSIVLVLILTIGTTFGQETERSISIYLDADSGYIAGSRKENDTLWNGNQFEVGLVFAQNFADNGLDWLSLDVSLFGFLSQSREGYTTASDNFDDFQAEIGLYVNGACFGVDALDFRLSVDTETFIEFGLGYQWSLENHYWILGIDTGLFAYKYGNDNIFDTAYLTYIYGCNFAKIWGFETVLEGGVRSLSSALEEEGEIGNIFYIQWDNNIILSLENGFETWAGVRLNFVHETSIGLIAGMSYTFDF